MATATSTTETFTPPTPDDVECGHATTIPVRVEGSVLCSDCAWESTRSTKLVPAPGFGPGVMAEIPVRRVAMTDVDLVEEAFS